MQINFEFSDTISGYVKEFKKDAGIILMETCLGKPYEVKLTTNTFARIARNLGEPYFDGTNLMKELLVEGQMIFVYGIFYPKSDGMRFEAKIIDFPGKSKGKYRFEEKDWWINQAREIAAFFIRHQFQNEPIDYKNYRTILQINGDKRGDHRQETDTISRLVYGLASTYMLTGEDLFLEAAEKGTQYLRDHMRFYDTDEDIVYWYHGIDVKGEKESKVFASEFGDDYDAIPMYEQIYALAGPTQTYRITGDPKIMNDIKMTIKLFDDHYLDDKLEGYFSHLDPITLNPRSDTLGSNQARKNWNSVGDHAPAYLINLWLATGEEKYKKFLEYTADCIEKYFQDYDNSPFVQERFHEDWSHDKTWGWQQDCAVVGHNLKIAWNLMRINSIVPKDKYVTFAKKIAELMPKAGMDQQRSGWYDVVSRTLTKGESVHPFTWHDRKAWWQQEQGILAYEILYGVLKDDSYLKLARESAAFYNTYFPDHDDGAIYFNVLNNGLPYLLGNERYKGSHSMSGYHSIELAYLASVYTNLLNTKNPLDLYFKPYVDGFEDRILRVQPDILPVGSVYLSHVWIDGEPYEDFDADAMTVKLPESDVRQQIKVRITPR